MKKEIWSIKKSGFSLVELLLSISIFGVVVLGLSSGLIFSMQNAEITSSKTAAIFLAEEGLEAVRTLRAEDFANLVDGVYGLDASGNTWAFIGASENIGEYTRTINITSVDPTTRLIESVVSWPGVFSSNNSVNLSTYLTDIYRTVAVIVDLWTNPTLGNTLSLSGGQAGRDVTYFNGYAYFVRGSGSPSFATVDVSVIPPIIVDSQTVSNSPRGIAISHDGSFGVIASSSNSAEVQIFSLTNPSSPIVSSTYNAPGNQDALDVVIDSNNYVYFVRTSGGSGQLTILQVSNPSVSPTFISSTNSGNTFYSIDFWDDHVYIASSSNTQELIIYNVSNPANPILVGSFNKPGTADCRAVRVFNSTALLGCDNGFVYALDITNPASPILQSNVLVGSIVNHIDKNSANTIAFIGQSTGPREFVTININDPTALSLRSELNLDSTVLGLVYDYDRDLIYAAGSNLGAQFLIFNPE